MSECMPEHIPEDIRTSAGALVSRMLECQNTMSEHNVVTYQNKGRNACETNARAVVRTHAREQVKMSEHLTDKCWNKC